MTKPCASTTADFASLVSNPHISLSIFSNLSSQNLALCSLVSKLWNTTIDQNNKLWNQLCIRDFPLMLNAFSITEQTNYKNLYITLHSNSSTSPNTLITQSMVFSSYSTFESSPVLEDVEEKKKVLKRERPQDLVSSRPIEKFYKKQKLSHDQRIDNSNALLEQTNFHKLDQGTTSENALQNEIIKAIEEARGQDLKELISQLPTGIHTLLNHGTTPLLYAIEKGNPSIVSLLLSYQVHPSEESDLHQQKALSQARFNFCRDFQLFLQKNLMCFPGHQGWVAVELQELWSFLPRLPYPHVHFGLKEPERYANICLKFFKKWKQNASEHQLNFLLIDEISLRAEVLQLIQHRLLLGE